MSIIIPDKCRKILLDAETSKALATQSENDCNVVPVSSIQIKNESIWLIDYFFSKTKDNLLEDNKVSLVSWKGLEGFQIKADATYITKGVEFDEAKRWISTIHPNRTVKGLVILYPREIFDISINSK